MKIETTNQTTGVASTHNSLDALHKAFGVSKEKIRKAIATGDPIVVGNESFVVKTIGKAYTRKNLDTVESYEKEVEKLEKRNSALQNKISDYEKQIAENENRIETYKKYVGAKKQIANEIAEFARRKNDELNELLKKSA
jgi:predicted RNase H-like nuclease (RuvC/YqgF family)